MASQDVIRTFRERSGRKQQYLDGLNFMQYVRFQTAYTAEMKRAQEEYENWSKKSLLEHRKQLAFGVIGTDSIHEKFRCARCHLEFYLEVHCDVFPRPKFWGSGIGGGIFLMNPSGEITIPWRCYNCGLLGTRKYVAPLLQLGYYTPKPTTGLIQLKTLDCSSLLTIYRTLCPGSVPFVILVHRRKPRRIPDDKLLYPGIDMRPERVHRVKFGKYRGGITITRQMSCKCHGFFRIIQINLVDLVDKEADYVTEIND